MKLGPGELRENVSLYSNAPTAAGDVRTLIRTQWCKIEPAGARAVEIGAVQGNVTTHKLTFRHEPIVEQGWWAIAADGTKYRIDRVLLFPRDRQEAFGEVLHQ